MTVLKVILVAKLAMLTVVAMAVNSNTQKVQDPSIRESTLNHIRGP